MNDHIDPLRSRLSSIAIEVSSKCNLRCGYCHKSDDFLQSLPGADEDMAEEMIADLYRSCKEAGIGSVWLSMGGETTTVAGWHRRVARFLDDPAIETHMVSNFARPLTDEELDALSKFTSLQISFDSSDLAMVRKLRGKADLRTIAFNIIRLRQASRERSRSPFLVVNCTLCRDNIGHISGLAGFCRELGVDQLMLTEVMTITRHDGMPETLDRLTDDEVILLARQIIAARHCLQGSTTELRLREHLQARIGETVRQLSDGAVPPDAGARFHRRPAALGCRQPWESPFITATGHVLPCCGSLAVGPIGNVTEQSLCEIMDGAPARAIRASILDGRPTVACETCSFNQPAALPDLPGRIGEPHPAEAVPAEPTLPPLAWPGLLGSAHYPVLLENAVLEPDEGGVALLLEDPSPGYHRVMIEVVPAEYAELRFRARPRGRRRLRLDCYRQKTLVGRSNLMLGSAGRAATIAGPVRCAVTAVHDRWYEVTARFSAPELLSEINLFLMSENDAVSYDGERDCGLELAGLSVTGAGDGSLQEWAETAASQMGQDRTRTIVAAPTPVERGREPLVSVILLTFNHERFVREALDGLLSQTYPRLDIVIADDASSDRTPDIIAAELARYPHRRDIRFVRNERNLGGLGRFNGLKALGVSNGEFIVGTCGDDVMSPTMIARMVEAWRTEAVSLVTVNAACIDENSQPLGRLVRDAEAWDASFDTLVRDGANALCFQAGIGFERSLYDEFGFPPQYLCASDIMLPFYAFLAKGARFIPEPLLRYRIHPNNTSLSLKQEASGGIDSLLIEENMRYLHLAHAFLMESELDRLNDEDPSRFSTIVRHAKPLVAVQIREMADKLVNTRKALFEQGVLKLVPSQVW